MTRIEGHELDIERSSDGTNDVQWRLVFTQGLFQGPGVQRSVEPVQFLLKRSDYNNKIPVSYYIYYDPVINKYQFVENDVKERCEDYGYNLGGFIVADCKLTFIYPKCTDDVTYIRPWTEEFTEAYEKRNISCEEQADMCGQFRDTNFNNDFEIDCVIVEDDNAFYYAEFDPEEFETIEPEPTNL